MLFRQMRSSSSGRFSYLLASASGGDALLIDPVPELLGLSVGLLRALDLRLVRGLATSSCPVLVEGLEALRERTGCLATVGAPSPWAGADTRLGDGEVVDLDGLRLEAVHTPGVRADSYCYVMDDRVFTGATLLVGAVGPCHESVGDPQQHYASLFTKLLKLPGELLVFPSLGNLGQGVSTVAKQRASNPRLLAASVDQFVEESRTAIPEQLNDYNSMRKSESRLLQLLEVAQPVTRALGQRPEVETSGLVDTA